jgi:hypothetical protein
MNTLWKKRNTKQVIRNNSIGGVFMKRKIGILFALCCMAMFAFTACKSGYGLNNSTVDDNNGAGTDNNNDATDNTIGNGTTNGTTNNGTNGTLDNGTNGTNGNGTINNGTTNDGTTNGINNRLTPTGIAPTNGVR